MADIEAVLPDIDEITKDKVRSLIINNYRNFAFKTDEFGHTNLVKHSIDTQGKGPIRQRAYRNSTKQKEIAQEIIDDLLENKIIRFSMFPWATPMVLVKKKDRRYPFVCRL